MEEAFYKQILDNYYGNWINSEGDEVIKLTIKDDGVTLIKEKGNKLISKETFPGSCHWFDKFLCFTGAGRFYNITHADKDHLVFGKQEGASLGNYEWRKEFKRVK